LYVHIYGKLENVQLSVNLSTLCHIKHKCNHPVNFHFSLEFLFFNLLTYLAPVLSKWCHCVVIVIAAADLGWLAADNDQQSY